MAAPTHTARTPPTGYLLKEGFKSTFAFNLKPAIQLWERDLKPLAVDGGEPIDITTQFNTTWHTMFPRRLKRLDPFDFVAGYDPDAYSDIIGIVNVNQSCSFFYPDSSYIDFYGFLQKFVPAEFKIGEFPTAACTVCPTNWDGVNNVEAAPVFTAAPGT